MAPSKREGKPSRKKEKSNGKRKKVEKRIRACRSGDIELYCVCQQPWDGNSLMVQCDQCQDWFHPKCVGVSRKDAKDNPFICPQCHDKPILKLINYKMGSYSKKMQISYYESIDPNRLYQMYSIPFIIQNDNESHNHLHSLDLNELNTINNNDDMQFYRELVEIITKKKNKIQINHICTINECNKYLLSSLFAKYCDLVYNMNKSSPYLIPKLIDGDKVKEFINRDIISCILKKDELKNIYHQNDNKMDNNMAQYSLIDISSIMCLKCNGQIPTNVYMNHIEGCYINECYNYKEVHYDYDYDYDYDLLFESMNEESASDVEIQLSNPDIFDRKKVMKQLITKQNKNKLKSSNSLSIESPINSKDFQIFQKIYDTFYDSNDDDDDDDDDDEDDDIDDDDDDDDDDIPIAQNINDKLQHNFKRYYNENKIRKLKRKQKEFLNEKNDMNYYCSKYHLQCKSDTLIINKLTKILLRQSNSNYLSLNKSKEILNKLIECDIKRVKSKHCGIICDIKEHNEEKTMRMDGNNINNKYLYFCHEKLSKNGLCSIHKNWRTEKYKELLFNLENQIQEIFLLNCTLKQINNCLIHNKEKQKRVQKQRDFQFEESLQNDLLFDNINPSISIKIDKKQTDIDLLLQSTFNDDEEMDNDHLQNLQNNAVLFP